jgi:hypothetical protein
MLLTLPVRLAARGACRSRAEFGCNHTAWLARLLWGETLLLHGASAYPPRCVGSAAGPVVRGARRR